MVLSFIVILIGIVILCGMGSSIWTLARSSDAQRRKILTILLLNWHVNSAGANPSGELPKRSARECREAKHAAWQQRREHDRQTHVAHSHTTSHGWHSHSEGHHIPHSGHFGSGHH